MVFDIFTLVEALWLLLPAYAANGLAPFAKYTGSHPIDGGRLWRGRAILGKGKTWEGLFIGVLAAVLVSLIQFAAFPHLPWGLSPMPLNIVTMSLGLGIMLGLGSMAGDMIGSFIKRRINLGRGKPAPILDQDDFVLGAFVFASLIVAVEISWLALFLIITPVIHVTASFIGYKLGIKKDPW
jgi:CDP-2,3-bis-(O-geranylgeranyl)-sn-glycerol synthase